MCHMAGGLLVLWANGPSVLSHCCAMSNDPAPPFALSHTDPSYPIMRLRIGIVGAGFAAQYHVACMRRVYGAQVEIAGVTSLRRESRDGFGRSHGIPVFESVHAMLKHVDIVDICSPPYAHEESILAAAAAGKPMICEKPLTGYFCPEGADETYRGDRDSKEKMLTETVARLRRFADAVRASGVFFGYAENFVYAPSVQKEREIITKTGAQILHMTGQESHNGSASPLYGVWRFAGGGSLIGKACHPLGGMLYLKRAEGLVRNGKPIRPASVSARTHQLTRLQAYRDLKLIRTDYHDIEDYGFIHVVFEDGTVADVIASEVSLGGIYDYMEVFANNHRTRCNISPAGLMDSYNPRDEEFRDIYLVEKASTKEGWSRVAVDENFTMGYQHEIEDFVSCAATGRHPQSDLALALDTTAVIYAAYLSNERHGAEVGVPRL
jgi:predicted dehydrogenase